MRCSIRGAGKSKKSGRSEVFRRCRAAPDGLRSVARTRTRARARTHTDPLLTYMRPHSAMTQIRTRRPPARHTHRAVQRHQHKPQWVRKCPPTSWEVVVAPGMQRRVLRQTCGAEGRACPMGHFAPPESPPNWAAQRTRSPTSGTARWATERPASETHRTAVYGASSRVSKIREGHAARTWTRGNPPPPGSIRKGGLRGGGDGTRPWVLGGRGCLPGAPLLY